MSEILYMLSQLHIYLLTTICINALQPWQQDISTVTEDYLKVYPTNAYKSDDQVPIELLYPKSYNYYTSCAESYLYIKFKIVKQNGSDLAATDVVAPGQQFGQQLFSSVHVFVNGTCTTYQPNFYPFRQGIEQLLTTSSSYQKSVLSQVFNLFSFKYYSHCRILTYGHTLVIDDICTTLQELFYRDVTKNSFTSANTGFKQRFDLSSPSKSVELITRIGEFPFTNIRQLPQDVKFAFE